MAKKNEETPNGGDAITNIGKRLLEENPEWQEVHITSDGYGFGSDADAKNHAKGLVSQTVVKVSRTLVGESALAGDESTSAGNDL